MHEGIWPLQPPYTVVRRVMTAEEFQIAIRDASHSRRLDLVSLCASRVRAERISHARWGLDESLGTVGTRRMQVQD
jgi:hypothetical protein